MNRTLLKPATVAIFLPDLRGGGAERVMLNLACSLAELDCRVQLVLVSARGVFMDRVPDTVEVVDLGARQTLAALPSLISYLKRKRPQVLISALEHTNVLALWAKRLSGVDTKIAVCVHNYLSEVYRLSPTMRNRFELAAVRASYGYADHTISVSTGVAEDLAGLIGIPRSTIEVLYNPVITNDVLEKIGRPLDHPWFAPGQPPVILTVGRLTAQKDQAMLVRAFEQLRSTMPARLLILGEGEERPALERLVRDLHLESDVSIPGFVDNPYAYMNRAAVFALSSRYEGLPTVLIEALACGARIVSTDCPSGPKEILVDGKYGVLTPVGNVEAMALALKAAIFDKDWQPDSRSWTPYGNRVVAENYARVLGLIAPVEALRMEAAG